MDPVKDNSTTSDATAGGLLGLCSNALSAKRETLNDLHAEIHGNESPDIHMSIDQHHSEHRQQHQGERERIEEQGYDEQTEQQQQQQDGDYFTYFKAKLLSLDEQPTNTNITVDNSNSNQDKSNGKEGVEQQSNHAYNNTGGIEIIHNTTPIKESTIEIGNVNLNKNATIEENSAISKAKHDLLSMLPASMASQLQSYSSSPESRDAFNFTPAKLSMFQNNIVNPPSVKPFYDNDAKNSLQKPLGLLQSSINPNNHLNQIPQSYPTTSNNSNSSPLSQLKKNSLWGIKASQIVLLIAIISSILGLASFYASDAHDEQGVLIGIMYPLYGLLFQIILIPLHRSHYLSLNLPSSHSKPLNSHTILAATSRNQDISNLLNIRMFLFIYRPILISSFILTIIISIIYGLIIELGIINRLNDRQINARELLVIQTILRLLLMILIVLINALIIAFKKYTTSNNQNSKDNTQIQSNNNYLGTVYEEFKADMANIQNNLHVGLTTAIQQQIIKQNNHMVSQLTQGKDQEEKQEQQQHKEINNNNLTSIVCQTQLPSNDTEQFHETGQGIILQGQATSGKKLVTSDDSQHIELNGHNANGTTFNKTFNKSITLTGDINNKRQQILLQTPFKDKSVTWNDQHSPPKHIRTTQQYQETDEEEQITDSKPTTHQLTTTTKSIISNHIHLFTTPVKPNGMTTTVPTLQDEFAKNHSTSVKTTENNPLLKNLNQSGVSESSTVARSKLLDDIYPQHKDTNGNLMSNLEISAFWSKISTSEILSLTIRSLKLILIVFFTHFFGVSIIANYTLFDHEIGFYFLCLGFYAISVSLVAFLNGPPKKEAQMKIHLPNISHNSLSQKNQFDSIFELCNNQLKSSILIACVGCNAISFSLSQSTRSAWILMGIRLVIVLCVFVIPPAFAEFKFNKAYKKYLNNKAEVASAQQRSHQGGNDDKDIQDQNNINKRANKSKILLKIQTKSSPSPGQSPLKIPNYCKNTINLNHDNGQGSPLKINGQNSEQHPQQCLLGGENPPNHLTLQPNNNILSSDQHAPRQNTLSLDPSLKAIAMFQTQRTRDLLAQQEKSNMDIQIQSVQNTLSQNIQNLITFCISQGSTLIAFIFVTFIAKYDGLYHFRNLRYEKDQFDGDYSNVYLVFLIEILSLLLILVIAIVLFNRKSITANSTAISSFLESLAINLKQGFLQFTLTFLFIQQLLYILLNN